jgi:transposase InsO family protein
MFVVASASFRLLYVMIILAHDRRKIVRFDVTRYPTAGWLARQVTDAFPWDTAPRYLLRDRDASYGQDFRKQVDAMGITEVVSAARSPWQNAYVERVIGSLRRECLDHEQRERLEKEGDDAAAELSALLTRLLDELQS